MKRSTIIIIRKKWMQWLKRGRNHKKNIYPGTLSISNSTPSLAKTNNSLVKGTGIPLGNNWGFIAIFSLSIKNQIKSNQIKSHNKIDLGWGFDLFANFIKGKINETGLQTSRVYQGLYGPILSKPEKGPDFRFTLTYLGRVWLEMR